MSPQTIACLIVAGPPILLCLIWITHDVIVAARHHRSREAR